METCVRNVILTICVHYFLIGAKGNCEDKVDYYLNLIHNEEARFSKFSLPNNSNSYRPLNNFYTDYGSFDHIIVGAGAAGAIIASRLSEDQNRNVLLLEAGGDETDFTDIPSMAGYSLGLEYNWNYFTTPQTNSCLGMVNKQCRYPRGKGLGGSTTINGLAYTRGNKRDYDNWYLQGNEGWSYQNVLPVFKRIENFKIGGDRKYRGVGGNLNVEYNQPFIKHMFTFLHANQELNRSTVDYNGKNQLGVGVVQLNTVNGKRGSTSRVFLDPVRNRKNLKVLTDSYAIKILISPKSKRAYGILFVKSNKYYVVNASKDIIISAGVIGSPQLLMLSGIGPKLHLQQLNISTIQDLPVGNNFQDHFAYSAIHFETNYTIELSNLKQLVKEFLHGRGPLTNALSAYALGFIQTSLRKIEQQPDIEFMLLQWGNNHNIAQKMFNWNDDVLRIGFPEVDLSRSFTIQVVLLHPKSKGHVRLKSSNPFDYPIINPKYLSDQFGEDIETLYRGIQNLLTLLDTNTFKNNGVVLKPVFLPVCKDFQNNTRDYWICHLRHLGAPYAHPFGTCRMGINHFEAVVNSQLQVYGVKNLRVADASVIPSSISGHISAAVMMIGEKASQIILSS